MTILKKRLSHTDKNGDETWYYLARETETGRVFILHEWDRRGPDRGQEEISLAEFLNSKYSTTARTKLFELVGALATEENPY